MGNESIDLRLEKVWESWWAYRKGKSLSRDLLEFQDGLEENLFKLFNDLNSGSYIHGKYRTFTVSDNKKREISVAGIRDRVVHRLLYDHLTEVYDKTFIHDAWSCRLNKGLIGAIERVQSFFNSHPQSFVWKSDIQKFFDNVDHDVLLGIVSRKIKDPRTFELIKKVIRSFSKKEKGIGMPIGNLTSQIFSNVYLNELDRLIKNHFKPQAYARYGDDFIVIESSSKKLFEMRKKAIYFLQNNLKLSVNSKSDSIRKIKQGLKFLGVVVYPKGRKLTHRNQMRVSQRLNLNNVGSYWGLVSQHDSREAREFHWKLFTILESFHSQ